jgi:signal transduction histidine kinase
MMRPVTILSLLLLMAASLLFFMFVLRQIRSDTVTSNATADMEEVLRTDLEAERRLGQIDRAHADVYRRQFDREQALLHRLQILDLTRHELNRRVELLLIAAVAIIVIGGAALYLLQQRSRERRLAHIGSALEAMSQGESLAIDDRHRDLIGRIARMIDGAAALMTTSRRRIQSLEHLSAWQEAARRHAHEIRTPLTAAQLELERLVRAVEKRDPAIAADIRDAETSIVEELDQLRRFTSGFASFAMIGPPQLRSYDIGALLDEFCLQFAPTWPNLAINVNACDDKCRVDVDREMIRQVLVNLCSNSALAVAPARGRVQISAYRTSRSVVVDVADDGPGIAPEIRTRLFEPYTTTRKIGEGMGLGLSISKKIMLDHGGDLDLVDLRAGATFRLTFPLPMDHG